MRSGSAQRVKRPPEHALGAKAARRRAHRHRRPGFHLVSFLLGILAALAAIACYAIQTDRPGMFDAPLGGASATAPPQEEA